MVTVNNPLVSVVIPAYNQAHYLAQAIDSVLAQSSQDFELIIVDDGSTDHTAGIAKKYEPALHYLYQHNQGLAGARNTGIAAAQGEYVALLDSDDAWQPDYLAQMLALASAQPEATVYYCGVLYMDEAGQPLPQAASGGQTYPPAEMYHRMLRANFLVPSTILMKREPIIAAGKFDVAFRRLQDWELWVRLLRQGHKFAGISKGLVYYRLHGSSLSTDPTGGQKAAMALAVKHFGPDDGRWDSWPEDKRRAYGGVYRYHALTSSLLRQSDWHACANYLRRAIQVEPALATDLDLFYELALGTQPLGQRGTAYQLDLEASADHLADLLAAVFATPVAPGLAAVRQQAYGTAFYALGLVAYNVQQYAFSRRFMLRAVRYNPGLGLKSNVGPTVIKSIARSMGV